tara:strand:- start:599 stop:826 length:228 start_codon:yes stop_codon:yes gene_type:complete
MMKMITKKTKTNMKDGVYESDNARYFVQNGKVLMNLKGIGWYKTTKHFNFGTWVSELNSAMSANFDTAYVTAKQW